MSDMQNPARGHYRVWCPDTEEEWDVTDIKAFDVEQAAEKWAEEDDWTSAEYRIANGATAVVSVRDSDGEIHRCEVSAEPSVVYCANIILEDTKCQPS